MINPPSTNFAEQWVQQYTQLNKAISYKSFDFNGIKRSLVEYLRTYHPEYFNNLTETDELLPLIEMFAYIGELYAYRADVNTQEHILSAATRKSSAIQIANMLGYTPSRRTAAIGLVKITSVSTTESIIDSDGTDLQRRTIKWTDRSNSRWKSQFDTVISRVLNNTTGIKADSDKTQVENVTFERYVMNTKALVNGVYKYSAQVNGISLPMELIGTTLLQNSITELSPTGNRPLDILYANDGFGDTSSATGYMFLTKQGVLTSTPINFTGSTVNLTQPINVNGINDTDVWLNTVDTAGNFLTQWNQVDNIAYNSSTVSTVYQVISREGDQISLVFGDGNYATIPTGNFKVWYRTSAELDNSIPISAIVDKSMSVDYLDSFGNTQTFTCTFSLQSTISTSSSSETLANLKQAIPGVFYTQNRMVNAQDHQNYFLQDPSIAKIKAVNRTFAGHSKYSSWYDGSESYENVKTFSNDGILYFEPHLKIMEVNNPNFVITPTEFVSQYLTPVLSYPDMWLSIAQRIGASQPMRDYFYTSEQSAIAASVNNLSRGVKLGLIYENESWVIKINSAKTPDITVQLLNTSQGWSISTQVSKTIVHSDSTRFWQYSANADKDYDTTNPTRDLLTILSANANKSRTGVLETDIAFHIVKNIQLQIVQPYQANIDLNKVEITETDSTADATLSNLLNVDFTFNPRDTSVVTGSVVKLPSTYIAGDILSITGATATTTTSIPIPTTLWNSTGAGFSTSVGNYVKINAPIANYDTIKIVLKDWVYFSRTDATMPFVPVQNADLTQAKQFVANKDPNYKRFAGRSNLNFLWQHFTDEFEIINPARTNITDLYLITKQYYTDFGRWLKEGTTSKPSLPTTSSLSTAYSSYMKNAMMSDELILRPGKFKVLFGPKSEPTLRATIQLVVGSNQQASNDTIKQDVVDIIRKYFDISNVEFGDTFYFSNLSSYIQANSKYSLGSILLIPMYPGYQFGDLYELTAAPDEIFVADVSITDIEIVNNLNAVNLRQ